MKNLLFAIVIGLAIGIPASASAGVNALGVKLPVDTSEPKNNVESGFVPETALESYQPQKLNEKTVTFESDRYSFSGFGVNVDSSNRI